MAWVPSHKLDGDLVPRLYLFLSLIHYNYNCFLMYHTSSYLTWKTCQVCVLLLQKRLPRVTCLEKAFILQTCSQKVLIIAFQLNLPVLVCCFCARWFTFSSCLPLCINILVYYNIVAAFLLSWTFLVLIAWIASQVALGDMAELQTANYNADKLPPGKLRYDFMLHRQRMSPDLLLLVHFTL